MIFILWNLCLTGWPLTMLVDARDRVLPVDAFSPPLTNRPRPSQARLLPSWPHVRSSAHLCLLIRRSDLYRRPDIFDEYTRRQYIAKAPSRNPFGDAEEPGKFVDFDIFTKIRVLHQLSTWTLYNPNRIREYYAPSVPDTTQWVGHFSTEPATVKVC